MHRISINLRSINGGNDSRWFCAKLFHRREDAIKNGVGEPLCGEVRFICGKTSVESAYLCTTGGEVSPDIVTGKGDVPGRNNSRVLI